jgi:MoxR-like ATPase
MADKLTYDELKLGEKAKEAFLAGKPVDYIRENCPVYLNTREVYAGLNVTDLSISFVLAGIPGFLIGNAGCGKSQLARDFHNYYFSGSKNDGGYAITIEGHPELDIYTEVLTNVDMQKMARVLNRNHEALYFDLEEFNRCPPITQNQFYAIGNGRLINKGISIPIGRCGYRACIQFH